MKHISIRCHGKTEQKVLHQTQTGRYYVMERRPGGQGVKRVYVYPKQH